MLNRKLVRITTLTAAFAAMTLGTASTASAASILFNINIKLEAGAESVAGDQTVATLLFQDVAANQVQLTVTSSLNDLDEFISDISFNVNSSFVPSAISASFVSGSQVGAFELPTLSATTQNAQNPAGPGVSFDLNFPFETSNANAGAARFNGADSFQYLFSAAGLDALDFNYSNLALHYAYAHVQGIGLNALNSTGYVAGPGSDPFTPVPEPASILLLGAGAAGLARAARKRIATHRS